MQKIKAVFFDCDGVVIDSGADIANAVNAAHKHFGYKEIDEKTLVSYVGDGVRNLIVRSLSNALGLPSTDDFKMDEAKLKEIMDWYVDYYNSHAVIKTTLYPGFLKAIKIFKERKIPLGIVTNKPSNILQSILRYFGIEEYFASTVCGDEVTKLKPDPEGLKLALSKINSSGLYGTIRPEETIMAGDSATDIQAGRNFGAFTCGIRIGLGNRDKLLKEKPDFVVDYAAQMLENPIFAL